MKPKIEISPADRLEKLKFKLSKAKKGFRLTKYDIVEETMESVIDMRSDTDALKEFVERNGIDPKKLNNVNKNWITLAAFTFVSGEDRSVPAPGLRRRDRTPEKYCQCLMEISIGPPD